jgi:primase-polymerase (primpol)-like protein
MHKQSVKTSVLPVNREGIPEVLKDRDQWFDWRLVPRKDKKKPAKSPVSPVTGEPGKTNDPINLGLL